MASKFQKIYDTAPIWVQNIMISVYGFKLKRERYGQKYNEILNNLKQFDRTSAVQMKTLQNKMFVDFLHFAVDNSPFYKEFYKDIDLSKIQSVDDIHLLPILDKETLRANIDSISTIKAKEGTVSFTGGTTGKSLNVIFTIDDMQTRMAYLDWFKSVHGFENAKMKAARFNGKNLIPMKQKSKIFWRDNYSIKQRIYSSFYTSQDNLKYYAEDINKFAPEAIDGFCSTIYEVADFMKRNNIVSSFKPKAIFPTSETVTQHHRDVIEDVFGAPIRDQYASSEGAPFIIECPCGKLHECLDTGVFEHVKSDDGATKLIVTSFTTHGTPLIRYDIGDMIIESENQTCDCGWGFPIVQAIDGRKTDYLYSPERGRINIANMSNVVKEMPNSIVNIQFVQMEQSHIDINVVVDRNSYNDRDEKSIINEMKIRLGDKMTFKVNYMDTIPRAKSGKYQFIIKGVFEEK